MNVVIDESSKSNVPKSKEDPFSFDVSCKDIIDGEGDQKFFHDTYFQTHLSSDHYQDSDAKDPEHTSSFFLELVGCNRPTH